MDIIFSKLKPYYKVVYDLCEARLQGSAFPLTNNFLDASRAAHKDQVQHLSFAVAVINSDVMIRIINALRGVQW